MPEDSEDYYQSSSSKDSAPEREESDENTTLVPKSFFQGKELEVGKKCEVEVVALYEDEAEIKYVEHKEKESKEKESKEKESEPDELGDPFAGMEG